MAEKKNLEKKYIDKIRYTWALYANQHYRRWRTVHQESYDFYLGDQLSKKQLEDLRSAGMPDFTVNMILPVVQTMKYFLTANNPRWKTVGLEGSDPKKAAVFSIISDYIWHISNGKLVLGRVVDDVISKSKGIFHVFVDPNADKGLGEVKITWEDPFNVYFPPNTKDPFGRDAERIIVHKIKTKAEVASEFPQFEKKIMKSSGQMTNDVYSMRDITESQTIQEEDIASVLGFVDESNTPLDFFIVYEKTKVEYVNATISVPPTEEEFQSVKEQIDVRTMELQAEYTVQFKELEEDLKSKVESGQMLPERMAIELAKAQKQMQINIENERQYYLSKLRQEATKVEQKTLTKKEFDELSKLEEFNKFLVSHYSYYETRIRQVVIFGDKILYDRILPDPISEYPVIAIPAIFTGTPYPLSFIAPAIGKQKEINKAHQIMIHNANLGSSLRWLIAEGTINVDHWKNYASSPGSLLFWNDSGTGHQPREILPAPLNNAFYTIVEKGKQELEYIVGIFSFMMGQTNDRPDTYRGILAMDEHGTRRLKSWINEIFEPGLGHLGIVVHQFARSLYKIHKIFKIVQPNPETNAIETFREEINMPIYDDFGEIIGRYNDLQSFDYDVIFIGGSTMPLNRWALLEEYFRWFQAGLIDDIEFIKHTDIQDKEGVIERNSIYAKLTNQIKQLEQAIKSREGDIDTLSRQVLQLSLKAREYGMLHQMKSTVLKTQLEAEKAVNDLKAEVKNKK